MIKPDVVNIPVPIMLAMTSFIAETTPSSLFKPDRIGPFAPILSMPLAISPAIHTNADQRLPISTLWTPGQAGSDIDQTEKLQILITI